MRWRFWRGSVDEFFWVSGAARFLLRAGPQKVSNVLFCFCSSFLAIATREERRRARVCVSVARGATSVDLSRRVPRDARVFQPIDGQYSARLNPPQIGAVHVESRRVEVSF